MKMQIKDGENVYGMYDKRSLNLIILKILWEHTDAEHRLQQQEIVQLIKTEYGLEVDRRTIKNNVESLKNVFFETGLEIATENGYGLIGREFTDVELRMLFDSVLFSNQLSKKQAKDLIDKLKRLSSKYFNGMVSHVYNLTDLQYADNSQTVLYNMDLINEAIASGKKISFTYNVYGVDLQPVSKRKGYIYVASPYQMILHNGYYYLICNFDKYSELAHLRIDKMTELKVMDVKAKEKSRIPEMGNSFRLSKHIAEHVYMYGGKSVWATIRCHQSLIDQLIDSFGKNFRIRDYKNEEITIRVKCNEQALFYWALQYGTCAEVIEPITLREQIRKAIGGMAEKYAE